MPLSKIVANSITDDTITTDQIADTSVHGRRNLLINGAYQVFQRTAAATTATTTYTTADRWIPYESTDGAMTTEQSSDHPFSGFSLKAQVTTADSSIGAAQFCYIFQKIEAQNLQHLLYGTSSAKPLTLSFYVKSNKTGTYTINLHKGDNTAYNYVQEYTISSANTWEKKTITISPTAGSTSLITSSAGAINNDTGAGLEIGFGLAWGSDFNTTANTWVAANDYSTTNQVNWMDSTSNNFYLTEVQLEVGEVSNPVFEHRSFNEELILCQRYYQKFPKQCVFVGTHSTGGAWQFPVKTEFRAQPTVINNDTSPYWENSPWISAGTSLSGFNVNISSGHCNQTGGDVQFTGTWNPTIVTNKLQLVRTEAVAAHAEL